MPLTNYTFQQLIDFTRTSAGTFVGSNGLIQNSPQSRNLLTFTQEFDNAAWGKTAATAVPFNPATASYGGDVSGTLLNSAGWTVDGCTVTTNGAGLDFAFTASNKFAYKTITVTPGRWYRFTITVSGAAANLYWSSLGLNGSMFSVIGVSSTTLTGYFFATMSTPAFGIAAFSGAGTTTVSAITVNEVIDGFITAPDGTPTADALIGNGANDTHSAAQTSAASATGKVFSVYAKAGTNSFLQVYFTADGGPWANFNVSNGTVGSTGTGTTASITAVGNGWYRCVVAVTSATAANVFVALIPASTSTRAQASTLATSVFLWGAQMEVGTTLTDYTRNVGGLFPPRFDYDPVTLAPRGILIEEQRTNLQTYSEQFDDSTWSLTNATVSANATVAPNGASTADKLAETSATGEHRVLTNVGITVVSGAPHTWSVFVKAAERSVVQLRNTNLQGATFDLASGGAASNITAGFTASAVALGNGWFRLLLSGNSSAAAERVIVNLVSGGTNSYAGTTGSGVFLWGAQLEAGAFATSYIPTVASQVTRTADQASIVAPMFAPWYNQSEGTMVVEGSIPPAADGGAGNYYWAIGDGTISNQIAVTDTGATRAQVIASGSVTFDEQVGAEPTGTIKAALAYSSTSTVLCVGGVLSTVDTSVSLPAVNRLAIGIRNDLSSGTASNGYVRRITYYPTRLSNAQLQALTA